MRTRELLHLEPGVKVRLTKKVKPDLANYWKNRTIYVDGVFNISIPGARIRSSRRKTSTTNYGFFYPHELSLVKE
jgi:hypothetical protein